MNAGIAPLLLRGTGSVSCSPRGHPSIVRSLYILERNTRGFGLGRQRFGLWKYLVPVRGIVGFAGFDTAIRFEPYIGRWIFPTESTEFLDFTTPLRFLLGGETAVILFWLKTHCPPLLKAPNKKR